MITFNDACTIVQQPTGLGEPVLQDKKHTLERQYPHPQGDRLQYWCSTAPGAFTLPNGTKSGIMILPDGSKRVIPTNTSLTILLDQIAKHTIKKYEEKAANLYIVAGRGVKNRPPWESVSRKEWFNVYHINGIESPQWKQEEISWENLLYYYERDDGFKVHLCGTCNYFGEELDLDTMYEAWRPLEEKLQQAFNTRYPVLLSTPAKTGKELLLISLPKGKQYRKLPDDILDLITHNFGQGRIETFPPLLVLVLDNGVYILDARWMYASCISNLPTGPCYRDKQNEFLGVRRKDGKLARDAMPGFYNVTAQVPEDWQHIGLLKSGSAKEVIDESGYYPNTPGETFTNWTTSAELANAINHGWGKYIHINERIFWPYQDSDPLAPWRRILVNLRAEIEQELEKYPNDKVLELHKNALRSILLHTIGSFHRHMDKVDGFTPFKDLPLPPEIKVYSNIASARGVDWKGLVPLPEKKQRFIHPEWSATVWGRARASLAEVALSLPREYIVSLRTDSIWCASPPEIEDTGKPGCFRVKEYIPGPARLTSTPGGYIEWCHTIQRA